MDTTSATTTDVTPKMRREAAGASFVGSVLEWYDFTVYASAAAVVFPKVFFPTASPAVGVLGALATFGVAFLMRPVGGALLASLGDRYGRKNILVVTLVLMGTATALMGALPTYAQIGHFATVLLVLLRLVQGLGAGAELGGATLLAVEYAPPGRRGLYGALASAGIWVGIGLAAACVSLVALLSGDSFLTWGWRLPFLASILVTLFGLMLRMRLEETPVFQALRASGRRSTKPLREVIRQQPRTLMRIVLIQFGIGATSQVFLVFSLSYAVNELHLSGSQATAGLVIAMAVAGVGTPLFGALSDRVGRRPVYLFGMAFTAVFAAPFFWIADSTSGPGGFWLSLSIAMGLGVGAAFGAQGVFYAEMLPSAQRYSGFALARETSNAVSGGFAPLVCAYLLQVLDGQTWLVTLFIVVMALLSVVGLLLVRETRETGELGPVGGPGPQSTMAATRAPG